MISFEDKPPQKKYFCEICKISCIDGRALQTHVAGLQHKKKQKALNNKGKGGKAKLRKLQSDIPPPLPVSHLKDYMNDPERTEPLIGMEYMLEFRYKGRSNPFYECKLCGFNTEVVPMIEHITGQNHRRAYLMRHHPSMMNRRMPNENRFLFFKRMAEEVEKKEGLKKYKCEVHERPYVLSTKAKKKRNLIRCGVAQNWLTVANPNSDSWKKNALEYMETFKITSDTEAAVVLSIATTLSASLKKFCKKTKRLAHMRILPSLMEQKKSSTSQASESEPTNPASKTEPTDPASKTEPTNSASKIEPTNQASENESTNQASKYVPTQPFTNYKQGNQNDWNQRNQNWNEEDKSSWTCSADKNWQIGNLSKGITQLKSLLEQTSSVSHTPSDSYGSQIGRSSQIGISSGLNAKDRATMSALQSSFALQPGNVGFGINEMMKQFNQTASVYCQPASAAQISPYFTSPQGSHSLLGSHLIQQNQGNGTILPNNRMIAGGVMPWDSTRDAPISYPVPMGYQTTHPTQGFPSWLGNRSMSGNEVSASFSSAKNITGWPQQSGYQQLNFRGNMGLNPFSGNPSVSNYQQQNTQLNSLLGGTNSGLTADIMRQLHGKDVATLTAMLQQLVPHYPDLQKINIHALARVLSEMT